MSDILFVTWDGGGNVPPATRIATELIHRGHSIRFLGNPSQAESLAAQGFDVLAARQAISFSAAVEASLPEMLALFADRGIGADLREVVRRRRPDLIVVDCMLFGAQQAAYESGVPYVVLEHLYESYFDQGCLRSPLALMLRAKRLRLQPPLQAAACRLVTALPDLDRVRPDRRPANLRHVGPTVDWSARSPIGDRGPVLISLSTVRFPGLIRTLQRVLDAVQRSGTDAILTTGPVVEASELRIPESVEVYRFVPHRDLMCRASMLIGHGGHGTTMQALAHDLPVLALPLGPRTDQPWVGRSLVAAGAGRMLRRTARSDAIASVMVELSGDGEHRAAARRLGEAIRRMPGATNGADVIEEILSRGPARRSRTNAAEA